MQALGSMPSTARERAASGGRDHSSPGFGDFQADFDSLRAPDKSKAGGIEEDDNDSESRLSGEADAAGGPRAANASSRPAISSHTETAPASLRLAAASLGSPKAPNRRRRVTPRKDGDKKSKSRVPIISGGNDPFVSQPESISRAKHEQAATQQEAAARNSTPSPRPASGESAFVRVVKEIIADSSLGAPDPKRVRALALSSWLAPSQEQLQQDQRRYAGFPELMPTLGNKVICWPHLHSTPQHHHSTTAPHHYHHNHNHP